MGQTPAELAALLVGSEVTLSSITYTGAGTAKGYFTGGTGNVGIASGVVLGSGQVVDVVGPNTADATTTAFVLAGDSDLNGLIPGYTTYDAAVLEFDFQCPEQTEGEDVISFQYVFTSEEYNEFVNSNYNDVFGFFLNGANIALLPGTTTPVSINNVNNGYSQSGSLPGLNPSNPAYYRNNDLSNGGGSIDIEADGLTVVLGAQGNIDPYPAFNHMRLAIADAGDFVLDSWVFIKEGSFHCAPVNQPPTADAGGAYGGFEGAGINLDGTGSSDPDAGTTLTYSWSIDTPLCSFDDATLASPTLTCTDNGAFIATLEVSDGLATGTDTATVTVMNVAPVVNPISVSASLVSVGTQINAQAYFTDQGISDTHEAYWLWGDGVLDAGTVTETAGSGDVNNNHTYTTPGVYKINLSVSDDDGGYGTAVYEYVVVYDPNGGFVTGGGWIDSPAGAYKVEPLLSGKASFGFVSKYLKGATIPTGNTEFQFHAGGLNFHSESYEWLVVAGSKAQYKGTGTINGAGEYKFMLFAGDGTGVDGADTFHIKIWTEDEFGVETVVYENTVDQAISGGSIIVHTKK